MEFTTVLNEMLYCPKCEETYEDGAARFCLKDNARLLPAPGLSQFARARADVFSEVLHRANSREHDEFADVPRFSEITFRPSPSLTDEDAAELENVIESSPIEELTAEKSFAAIETESDESEESDDAPPDKSETESNDALSDENTVESAAENLDAETEVVETADEIFEMPEIAKIQPLNESADEPAEELSDEATDVAWDNQLNPQNLIGQTVNDCYRIIEPLDTNEYAVKFLAKDEAEHDRQVVLRVLTDEDFDDEFSNKIFAEDRTTLAGFSHPSIISVADFGELPDGKPFVVTDYVGGESLEKRLRNVGVFAAPHAAQIIRQAANALDELHRYGVPHRNLNPGGIILVSDENGTEQVKLTDFGVSKGKLNRGNLPYKSPEQVEGKIAGFQSDQFALAVIAYRILSDRLPFNAVRIGDLLRQQREGLTIETTADDGNLPLGIAEILKKATAFHPADRYERIGEFGEAFYDTLTPIEPSAEDSAKSESAVSAPVIAPERVGAMRSTTTTKNSPLAPSASGGARALFVILGLTLLIAVFFGIVYYLARPTAEKSNSNAPLKSVVPLNQTVFEGNRANANVTTAPPVSAIAAPPNSVYFQNSKADLTGAMAEHFLGFSLYYPQNWKMNDAENKFLDVSKSDAAGVPIEQLLVTYYDSQGTFQADAANFPPLAEKSNDDLKKALGDYRVISEGATVLRDKRQAYEVKFESAGIAANGEKLTLWGRRLWIPAQIAGVKNGYIVTLVATSLSKDVTNANEVGVKGELAEILATFEPQPNL